ncbi:MAG: DNA-deoxyinosine glycosylase [Clostridia bacterium]|nr:DNA-deoxyinosine glycosylase [Clostridia bacterium]
MEHIEHPFPPLWDKDSKILILGSFPSVKSREALFFYGHPQNRFWRTIAAVLEQPTPGTVDEKREFLRKNHIALWDVISSCDIEGSSDASIKNAVPTDLSPIFAGANICAVFSNGTTSYKLYTKYQQKLTGRPSVCLPSTSPANAAWQHDRLVNAWSVIKEYLIPKGESTHE